MSKKKESRTLKEYMCAKLKTCYSFEDLTIVFTKLVNSLDRKDEFSDLFGILEDFKKENRFEEEAIDALLSFLVTEQIYWMNKEI